MEKMEKMKEMKERTSRKAGRRTAVLVLAVILGAGFYGCEDPNAESAPAPRSNKTVDRLEVLQDPYRALYEGDRLAEKLREFNPPAERVPRYSGYLEGEFLNDEHLVDLGPRNRLILHGLKVRIHHADGSSQDVEFPRDWQSNVMRQLGTDGRGMLFHWPNGKDWMTVELDGKSARFNTPFYPLQQVMIDVDATAALSPAPRKFYTMLESGMETATSGASGTVVRPKLVVKGYYGPGRGWLEIPEEVEVGTTFQPGYLGYLGPQDIRVLVYRGMLNENGVREAMPSSTSTSILTPNGSNYDDTYTIYTLPVFSFDDTAPQAAYTKLAPFEPGTFTVPSTVSSVIFAGGTTPPPAFAIGQYEIPYTLWYAVGQWASWYKDYFFSDRDIMSDAQKVAHVGNVGTVQQLTDNAAAFKTGRRGSASAGGAPPLADDYQPVTYIDWRDAALWCNAYTELLNAAASNGWTANWDPGLGTLSPEFAGGGSLDLAYGNGSDLKKVTDFPTDTYTAITLAASNKTGYRLPDEAEWEYAARGGSHATTPASGWSSPYGAGGAVGWYQGNAAGQTNPIGTTTAGFFSFTAGNVSYTVYDMIGNVAEWTNKIATPVDHLPTEIATANITENTYNEASCLTGRLVRGGSYDSDTRDCKLGFDRIAKSPGQARSGSVGFRIARSN